jgi:hypothetical protein
MYLIYSYLIKVVIANRIQSEHSNNLVNLQVSYASRQLLFVLTIPRGIYIYILRWKCSRVCII